MKPSRIKLISQTVIAAMLPLCVLFAISDEHHHRATHFIESARGSGNIIGPINLTPPTISGVIQRSKTLTASPGTWTESPSFTYQWERCNDKPGTCKSIAGATASTRILSAEDVGFTLRVIVTAKAGVVEKSAPSNETGVIEETGGTPTECFGREESCGYPGPTNSGVETEATLTKVAGNVALTKEGEHYENKLLETGQIEIKGNNIEVKNVKVLATKEKCGSDSGLIQVQTHSSTLSTGIVINHVTVESTGTSCPPVASEGISMREASGATNVTVENSKANKVARCFFQAATYENDYCNETGEIPGEHYDGIFANGEGTVAASPGLIVRHNTIIVPHWQTTTLFLSNEHEVGEELIENNLLAGSGYLIYAPGANTKEGAPAVKGPIEIVGNRLTRCLGKEVTSKAGGHHLCEGLPEENESINNALTPDAHGFFPRGGSYGALYNSYNAEKVHFSGNFWDNNLEAAL
jgi:hypothetical protein